MRVPARPVARPLRVPAVLQADRRRRALRRRVLWTGAELLVTVGVVLLLLVVHELWWTNRQARHGAERKVEALEREWAGGRGDGDGVRAEPEEAPAVTPSEPRADPGRQQTTTTSVRPRLSQAYAVLSIPRLDVRVPVAEGTGKQDVLNKGYVGHYHGTQQPGEVGNFALAGHRNTHGEPFRYVNLLRRGDAIVVETRTAVHTYAVHRTLPRTSPHDTGAIRPIPRSVTAPSYGYSGPGRYITLTTCTPEYTSRYRLVVWGKLVSTRPRAAWRTP